MNLITTFICYGMFVPDRPPDKIIMFTRHSFVLGCLCQTHLQVQSLGIHLCQTHLQVQFLGIHLCQTHLQVQSLGIHLSWDVYARQAAKYNVYYTGHNIHGLSELRLYGQLE